jgi:hypothetical protein
MIYFPQHIIESAEKFQNGPCGYDSTLGTSCQVANVYVFSPNL